jgi:phosphomethylpyrimidine synthase
MGTHIRHTEALPDPALPAEGAKTAHFRPMCGVEILLDDDHPRGQGISEAEAEAGMAEMSTRFHDEGGEIYLPAE